MAAFASSAMLLRRAEYDRAKKRLGAGGVQDREDLRQETYRLRTAARSSYYAVRLLADPEKDDALLRDAEQVIAMAREPNDAETLDELEQAGDRTKQAIDKVVDAANGRLREWTAQA